MGKSHKNPNPMNPSALFIRYADFHGLKWTKNTKRKVGDKKAPVGFYTVYKFKCDCKEVKWNEWESADIYAANGVNCDNPKCEKKDPVMPCLGPILSPTPCYFTPGRFQGRFQCPNIHCTNVWVSRQTFANKYQACQLCGYHAYSYFMIEKEPGSGNGTPQPHDTDNCEMCLTNPKACASARKGRGDGNRYFLKNPKKSPKEPREPVNVPGPDGFIEVINRRRRRRNASATTEVDAPVIKEVSPPREVEDGIVGMIEGLKTTFAFEKLSIE